MYQALQTQRGQDWLQSRRGRDWLKTESRRKWLQTESGKDWLHTPHGQAWQSTAADSVWVTMEEFMSTWETVSNCMIVPELLLLPASQVIQQFKTLPDFLMFPAFLAFRRQDQDHSTNVLRGLSPSNMEIICAMIDFEHFAREAQQRSRSTSDALNYACQNWAFHLLRAPDPRDDTLNHMFISFWSRHLLSWLERQWCLKGLRSCLAILSEGAVAQKFVLFEVHQVHHQSRRNEWRSFLFLPRISRN